MPDAAPSDPAVSAAPADGGLSAGDRENVRLLAVFHFVLAGLTFLFACLPLLHVAIGAFLFLVPADAFEHGQGAGWEEAPGEARPSDAASAAGPERSDPGRDSSVEGHREPMHEFPVRGGTGRAGSQAIDTLVPRAVGLMFVVIGGAFVLGGWTLSVLMLLAGRRLRQLRSHTFCLVVAGLECLFMPLGTLLGIFSIVVLMRPAVREAFTDRALRA